MKIVLFYSDYEYSKYLCADLNSNNKVIMVDPYHFNNNPIERILFHGILHLFPHHRFKSTFWFRKFMPPNMLNSDEEYIFCFFDASTIRKNELFLSYLREHYDCHLAVIVLNSLKGNESKSRALLKNFEKIYTFDPYDAKRFGLTRFYGFFSLINGLEDIRPSFALSFVGNDKGRDEQLEKIIKSAKEGSADINFAICGTSNSHIPAEYRIEKPIDFLSAISIELSGNCILDLCSDLEGEQGYSLRILEAVKYGRKILTNNKNIFDAPFYNDRYIQYFRNTNDIDWSFVKKKDIVNYDKSDVISPSKLIDIILRDFG